MARIETTIVGRLEGQEGHEKFTSKDRILAVNISELTVKQTEDFTKLLTGTENSEQTPAQINARTSFVMRNEPTGLKTLSVFFGSAEAFEAFLPQAIGIAGLDPNGEESKMIKSRAKALTEDFSIPPDASAQRGRPR